MAGGLVAADFTADFDLDKKMCFSYAQKMEVTYCPLPSM
jgi:hypothetical protein